MIPTADELPFGWQFPLAFLIAFIASAAVIYLSKHIPTLFLRGDRLWAVQKAHKIPTPRLGGLVIFFTLGITMTFEPVTDGTAHWQFYLAGALLFLVGLAEDLGFSVSPRRRLLAAVCSSLLVILIYNVWLPRTDIPGLDSLMPFWWVGVPLTLLITAGISNGFNMIDGVNGLASLAAIAGAIAMGTIAHTANHHEATACAALLACCVGGVFLWNYPFGRIFLGDAGAYTLGFLLSWIAISILLTAPSASPWALLLTLFWPVADMILAIWRRLWRRAPTMAPDRLHVHQLVMRALEIHLIGRHARHIANPLTTLLLAPFVIAPPIVGVLLWNKSSAALLATLCFGILFFGSYTMAFFGRERLARRSGPRHVRAVQRPAE